MCLFTTQNSSERYKKLLTYKLSNWPKLAQTSPNQPKFCFIIKKPTAGLYKKDFGLCAIKWAILYPAAARAALASPAHPGPNTIPAMTQ